MFCNIFDMMLSIIIYRNEEINCRPDKNKKCKINFVGGVLLMINFVIKNEKIM